MARFKFYMVGTSDTPALELPFANVRELNEVITRSRFIKGHMQVSEDGERCGVLVPTARIQLVMEAT